MEQQRKALETLDFSELIDEIKDLARGSWRFRWQAIAVAWMLCLPAWLYVFTMPDVYKASGRLYIDNEDSLRPLLRGLAIQSDLLDDVNVMLKLLLSRPTLGKIATKSGYDLDQSGTMDEAALAKRLADDIEIGMDRNQILAISVNHSKPAVALAIVSILTDEFVQGLLGSTDIDTRSAQNFLKKKLGEYETLLAEAEARLADFKKRNIGQMPGERGGYYSRLQNEMRSLAALDVEIKLARQRRDDLELQMAGEAPVFGIMTPISGAGSPATPQIAQLEAQLMELRLSYTDSHPDVIRTRELLESLRAEQDEARLGRRMSTVPNADMNPVYQQMKMQFNRADLELSQFTARRAGQAKIVKELGEKIDTIPEIEAELTRLNRSYDVYRSQYRELLGRLEQARLSEDAQKSSTSLQFRVIDPPSVTAGPVSPNRQLLITGGLLLAIACGMAFAVIRTMVSPVFYSSSRLERLFGMPVLGTIKRLVVSEERTKNRLNAAFLSAAMLGLIGCYGFLFIFDQVGVQIAGQLPKIFG